MKTIHTILKIILSLIIIMPIFGALGIFPPPTADMYGNTNAYAFIQIMMESQYITLMMAVVFLIALICLWTRRMALASLLLLPISLNIVGFHAFLDNGLFVPGAIMGNVLLLINLYFLWISRDEITPLLKKKA